jgi:hypothetical protein
MKPIPSDHIIRIKQLDGTRIYESDLINHQKEILRVEYVSNKDGDIREGRLSGKECMEMIRWVIPSYISVSKLVTDDSTSEAKDSKNRWPLTLFASIMGDEIMYGFNSPKAFEGKKNFLEHILPLDWDILYHIVLLTLTHDRKVLFSIIDDIETVFKIIAAKGGSTLEYKVRQQLEPPKPQQITFVPFEEGRGYYI